MSAIVASALWRSQTQLAPPRTITVSRSERCYEHSSRQVPLLRPRAAAYAAGMVLRMKDREFMRLRGARGAAIEVLDGRVWITEDGRHADSFVGSGERYRVAGDGLVLVGAERPSALRVRR